MAAATATKRFSKQTMIDDLQAKIEKLEKTWGFVSWTGSVQVERACCAGKVAYGQYALLCELLNQIEDNRF